MTNNLIFNEYQKSAMAEQYMGDDIMQISKHFSVIDGYLFYNGENTGMYLRGDQGLQGERGENGLSAYELAVANGFTGDEVTWIEGLKGEKGDNAPLPQLTVSAYNTSEPQVDLVVSANETGNNTWNFNFGIPAGIPLTWKPESDDDESNDGVPEENLTVAILEDVAVYDYDGEQYYSSDPITIISSENSNSILQENNNYEVVIRYTPVNEESSINLSFYTTSITENSDILLTHESESINIFIKYYENNSDRYYQIYSSEMGTYNVTIYDRGAVTIEEPTEPTGTEESVEPTEPTGTEEP